MLHSESSIGDTSGDVPDPPPVPPPPPPPAPTTTTTTTRRASRIMRRGSIMEMDLTFCHIGRVDELIFVYLSLVYAWIMRPISIFSLVYFLVFLVATPLYSYRRWFSLESRKFACGTLAVIAAIILIIETVLLGFRLLFAPTSTAPIWGLIDMEAGVRSFFLYSFYVRDLIIIICCIIALAILKAKEAQRMTKKGLDAPPLKEWPFFARYYRQLAWVLLILVSCTYPSLLSFPYYGAYVATICAWSLEFTESPQLAKKWETRGAWVCALYSLGYGLLIYLMQIPGMLQIISWDMIGNLGIINVLQSKSHHHVAIFILHSLFLFSLYTISSSYVLADYLETDKSTPGDSQQSNPVEPPTFRDQPSDALGSSMYGLNLSLSYRQQADLMNQTNPGAYNDHGDEEEEPTRIEMVVWVLQELVANYGMHLCSLAYVWLGLERPTIFGFVFMCLVFVGALMPNLVFRSMAPLLMMYTACYAAVVYWFGSFILRFPQLAGQAQSSYLLNIGLPRIDAYGKDWGVPLNPLLMTTLLALVWSLREPDGRRQALVVRVLKQAPWKTYLKEYLLLHDGMLYVILALCFTVAYRHHDGLHLPFMLLASFHLVFPSLAMYGWPLLVVYTEVFLLIMYWKDYQQAVATGSINHHFWHKMVFPAILLILSAEQLAHYVSHWRSQAPSAPRGSMDNSANDNPDASLAKERSSTSSFPLSARAQAEAKRLVNLSLWVTKILSQWAVVMLLWHIAFHSPLSVFSLGYQAFLSSFPLVFCWSSSINQTSGVAFPRLFRCVSIYCCLVTCLLYIFLCQDMVPTGTRPLIGDQLDRYGPRFMLLNWLLQLFCVTQTELLRSQVVDLTNVLRAYPAFLHSSKQILPFCLVIVIFAFCWEFISLFGAMTLSLGITNAILGRKVETVWRLMVMLSVMIAMLIMLFDFKPLAKFSSPTLFWLGLRRGLIVPDPEGHGPSPSASGWLLSPSAEAYEVIAFLAALQYFYNTGNTVENHVYTASPTSARTAVTVRTNSLVAEIDNTAAVGPTVRSLIQMLAKGKVEESPGRTRAIRPSAAGHATTKTPSSLRWQLAKDGLLTFYQLCHYLVMQLLQLGTTYSFEVNVVYVVIAAVMHSDLVGLLYLTLFVVLTTNHRPKLKLRWMYVVYACAALVMAEYLVVLRLPPAAGGETGEAAKVLGARQCSLFAAYTPAEIKTSPYEYGQWLGLCMTDDTLLIVDFVMLLLAILQSKRFRATKSPVDRALFSTSESFSSLNTPVRGVSQGGENDHNTININDTGEPLMELGQYLVLRYGAYVVTLTIFILSTLTYNMISLGYLVIMGVMVGNFAQEGLLTRRRYMWTILAIYSWIVLTLRILFQIPGLSENFETNSPQVLLGLRKVYASAYSSPEVPPEMIFDGVILILVSLQRRLFLSKDFKKILEELWLAEHYDYTANGLHVVNQLEKMRELVMAQIRVQITTMYEHLEIIKQTRLGEEDDDNAWEHFLLKNRLESSQNLVKRASVVENNDSVGTGSGGGTPQEEGKTSGGGPLPEETGPFQLVDIQDKPSGEQAKPWEQQSLLQTGVGIRSRTSSGASRGGEEVSSPADGGEPSSPPAKEHRKNLSLLSEASQGLQVLSHWVSGTIGSTTMLAIQDPLLMTEEEGANDVINPIIEVGLPGTKARQEALRILEEDEAEVNDIVTQMPDFKTGPTPSHQDRKAPPRSSRLDDILDQAFEGIRDCEENDVPTKAKRVGLHFIHTTLLFLNSRSTSMVYAVLVAAHMYQPSLLSLVYPLAVFGYALLQNPRSLPQVKGMMLHPMVQNPPRTFWNFLLAYSFFMLLIKFIFQYPVFCICDGLYSSGQQCPSSLTDFSGEGGVCVGKKYPDLDYYIRQPMVRDYYIGIYKAYHHLAWNDMSPLFEPVPRYVPPDVPGMASEHTLDTGLGGSFLLAFLGDFMVLLAVLWHTHVLKIRGVWLARDPGMYNDDHLVKRSHTATGRSMDEAVSTSPSAEASTTRRAANSTATECPSEFDARTMIRRRSTVDNACTEVGDDQEDLEEAEASGQRRRGKLTGLFSRLCNNVVMPCAETCGWRPKRTKPGADFYVQIFFVQVALSLLVIFGYQQTEHLFQSVKENQLSGGYLLVLFLHLVFVVVDRCIYLHRSIRGKLILQFVLLAMVFYLIHSSVTFKIGIKQHGPLFAWYLVMCLYFYFSALQICYGYPPFIGGNWLTKHVHHMWGNIYRIYRAIPFLYELRMLLDWTCTPTTLYLGEWIKVEDISSGIYICECNLNWLDAEQRKKGQEQPSSRKWRTGFLYFVLLNLLVWLPLVIFSTGSLSNVQNSVVAGSLFLQISGFPTLYSASTAEYISPMLPSDIWDHLVQQTPSLALLPATSTNDYTKELQYLRMPQASQEMWRISPPAKTDLLTVLGPTSDEDVSVTLRYTFGCTDTTVSEGTFVHHLSMHEREELAQVVSGNKTSVLLTGVLPTLVRVATTKEVVPLTDSTNKDCLLTFQTVKDTLESTVGWWEFRCGVPSESCGDAGVEAFVGKQASVVIAQDEQTAGDAQLACEPAFFTISSQKTIGSYFSFGYGIVGLYVTVVFTIGRFVHMSVMGMKNNIIYDDLPRCEVLKEICSTIYLARMYKNLILEEELYRELIDIYRRPSLIFERTGPYRHWMLDGDDIQAEYHSKVERDIAKYQ